MTTLRFTVLAFLFALISACAPAAPPATTPSQETQAASVPTATSAPTNTATPLPTSPSIGQRTKTSGCVSANALPDSACTPGAIFADATVDQICTPGYSATVRNVPDSVKQQVYVEYGIIQHSPGQYEVDHLIPLELGGSNDIANLWPQPAEPRPGFHEKDRLENYLHDQVCGGAMPLQEVQAEIANDWLTLYSASGAISGDAAAATPTPPPTQIPAASTATPRPTQAPATPATALSVSVVSLTSPAARGSNATLVIRTSPGANCTITVHYKSGPSKAQGLGSKSADANGQCSWTWKVGTSTTPGTWSISVTASIDGQSKSLSIPFVVQ